MADVRQASLEPYSIPHQNYVQQTSEDAGISQAQIGQLCFSQVNLRKVRSPCCSVKTDFGAADIKKGRSVSNGAQFAWKAPQEGTTASVKRKQ